MGCFVSTLWYIGSSFCNVGNTLWYTLACIAFAGTLDNVRSTFWQFWSTFGYIKSTLGYIKSTLGYIGSTLEYIETTLRHNESTLGNFGSVGSMLGSFLGIYCVREYLCKFQDYYQVFWVYFGVYILGVLWGMWGLLQSILGVL